MLSSKQFTRKLAARAWIITCALGFATSALSPLAAQAQIDKPLTSPKGITPKVVAEGSAKPVASLEPTQQLRLVIALRPPHMAEEEKFLQDLQTKGSPSFGKFLTPEEWNKRFGPSVADEQAVVDWAKSQGLTVTNRYPNRLLVDVEAPAATIEKALNVKFNKYQVEGKMRFSNDRDPEISANMIGIIQNIQGLNNVNQLKPMRKGGVVPDSPFYSAGPVAASAGSGKLDASGPKPKSLQAGGVKPNITGGAYDPTDIYSSQAYDVTALNAQGHCCNPTGNSGTTPPQTSIAIATAGTQQSSDFVGFHNQYPYLAAHWYFTYVDGTPSCCDAEGTMDFEWATAMSNSFGSGVDTAAVHMYDGVNSGFGTFDDIYNTIISENVTRVMSTSWGCEEIYCYDETDMNTTHAIFDTMIGEGWSLVVAAGDGGATPSCVDRIGVQYPSADPDVVSAGGTTLTLDSNSDYVSEVAWSGGPDGCSTNDGGSTGGESSYWAPPYYQSGFGYSGRAVPDLALNADWYHTPQNLYFEGGLGGNGGTSIVAPELSGMFAQFNAYLLALGNGPMGQVNRMLYYFPANPGYAAHYPYYDITEGCNNNDITAFYGLGYWCAGPGYDPVTGWGSVNALQLSWAINAWWVGDFGDPYVTFSGPSTSVWHNTDEVVSWTVTDVGSGGLAATGVSGFTQGWDSIPGDAFSEATPGSGNSFYSGPEYKNGTSGCLELAGGGGCQGGVSQGCHYAHVQGWDNSGYTSGDVAYGPVCYDTVAPVTSASLSGTKVGSIYESAVKVTLSASDATSGVHFTYYSLNGGTLTAYSGAINVTHLGSNTVTYYSVDYAGNTETAKSVSFSISSPTSTALVSTPNPGNTGAATFLTATVTATVPGVTPTGTVTFTWGPNNLGTIALVGGVAKTSTTILTLGDHTLTATYSGATNILPSVGTTTENIEQRTTTTLAISPNPGTDGAPITFTATVVALNGGTPGGSVEFFHGSTLIGTAPLLAGKATLTSSTALTYGDYSVTATYEGDSNYHASYSSPVVEPVSAVTTTSLKSSKNPSTLGSPVVFTATVLASSGPTATGTVTFKHGSTVMGTVTLNSSGVANLSYTLPIVGTYSITATYNGATLDKTSVSPIFSQTVNQ